MILAEHLSDCAVPVFDADFSGITVGIETVSQIELERLLARPWSAHKTAQQII